MNKPITDRRQRQIHRLSAAAAIVATASTLAIPLLIAEHYTRAADAELSAARRAAQLPQQAASAVRPRPPRG